MFWMVRRIVISKRKHIISRCRQFCSLVQGLHSHSRLEWCSWSTHVISGSFCAVLKRNVPWQGAVCMVWSWSVRKCETLIVISSRTPWERPYVPTLQVLLFKQYEFERPDAPTLQLHELNSYVLERFEPLTLRRCNLIAFINTHKCAPTIRLQRFKF